MNIMEQIDGVITGMNEVKNAVEAYGQAKYDQGKADQAAQQGGTVITGFTQEQVDAKVAEAVAPLEAQVIAQRQELDGVQARIDQAVSEAVQAALSAQKAEILSKIDAQQAAESASEQSLRESI